jgi:hypothetical protein
MITTAAINTGRQLSRVPTAGAVKITFARCLKRRAGGLRVRVNKSTKSQNVSTDRIRIRATRLNSRM